ncbi:MAG TPA: MauE/DoxX family redox-associated membrane protein [Gaiellaceae bacterium]
MLDVALACRFALATVFIIAAIPKLARRPEFELAIRGYRLVSPATAKRLAFLLPPIELLGGWLLAIGLGTVAVSFLLAACLVLFTSAVSVNLLRGRRIDCGCFGSTVESRISWWTVARNMLLLVSAAFVGVTGAQAVALDDFFGNVTFLGNGTHHAGFDSAFAFVVIGTLVVLSGSVIREAMRLRDVMREAPQ